MGLTAPEAEANMRNQDFSPGGIMLIEFGGNDCDMPWAEIAVAPDMPHKPKTVIESFERAIETMVQRAKSAGMYPVLVVPTPLDAGRYFEWVTQGLDRDAVLRHIGDIHHIYRWQECYANVVVDVAVALSCSLLNLRRAFLECMQLESLLCVDGIHPNAEGHALMLSCLEKFVLYDLGVSSKH
jgi:lysophospholipase L1-like esterase